LGLQIHPEQRPSLSRALQRFRSIGKLDRALADTSEAVRLDPRDAKAFHNRGDVFVDKCQSDLAIQDYDEALRLEVLD
jgi:tetratricopeptide (TPR) repeat protein